MYEMYDSKLQDWLNKHPSAQTTVVKCEKCGLFYKQTLGHECKCKETIKDCHIDERAEELIGDIVKVTLKNDNNEYIGKLRRPDYVYGYVIELFNKNYNLHFYKSRLKEIEKFPFW